MSLGRCLNLLLGQRHDLGAQLLQKVLRQPIILQLDQPADNRRRAGKGEHERIHVGLLGLGQFRIGHRLRTHPFDIRHKPLDDLLRGGQFRFRPHQPDPLVMRARIEAAADGIGQPSFGPHIVEQATAKRTSS